MGRNATSLKLGYRQLLSLFFSSSSSYEPGNLAFVYHSHNQIALSRVLFLLSLVVAPRRVDSLARLSAAWRSGSAPGSWSRDRGFKAHLEHSLYCPWERHSWQFPARGMLSTRRGATATAFGLTDDSKPNPRKTCQAINPTWCHN